MLIIPQYLTSDMSLFAKVAEKFNAFEFISVSTDTLNTAVQLARRDMRKQKTQLPMPIDPVTPMAGEYPQAHKVNRRQVKRKGDMKLVCFRLMVIYHHQLA